MDRIFAKDFDFAKRCGSINQPEPDYVPELVEGSDVRTQLLNAIYAIDPVTNLPTGDIACYLSPNTSPEVKQFIIDNLMMDVTSAASPRSADMSDEDLIALTRGVKETREEYIGRVQDYMNRNIAIVEDASRRVQPVQELVSEESE